VAACQGLLLTAEVQGDVTAIPLLRKLTMQAQEQQAWLRAQSAAQNYNTSTTTHRTHAVHQSTLQGFRHWQQLLTAAGAICLHPFFGHRSNNTTLHMTD
jgi:hypothetical protein